jgi:hypothetical protein
MDLYLPDIIASIEKRRYIVTHFAEDGIVFNAPGNHPRGRPEWLPTTLALMKSPLTQRYLFDSGEANSQEEIDGLQETTMELAENNLFALPNDAVWIEDYFGSGQIQTRACYLCIQAFGQILIVTMIAEPGYPPHIMGRATWQSSTGYCGWLAPPYSDASQADVPDQLWKQLDDRASTTTLMLQKFVCTLAASNTVRTEGETRRRVLRPGRDPVKKRENDYKTVIYGYTHIAPPEDDSVPAGPTGRRQLKRVLVRGYTWGRNTRPVEQQRRIDPYWRGQGEAVIRDHYEIREEKP